MTPFIKETVNWMSKTIDPTEVQWFDVSGSNLLDLTLDTEWLKKYRPPFPKCIVIWRERTEKFYMMLLGDDPIDGIIVKVWIGNLDKKPINMPGFVYFVEGDQIHYGSAEEGDIIKEEDATMILSFIGAWYSVLSKGCTAHTPEVKDTFTNRRKIAEGKKPMYEWRTVTIESQKEKSVHQGGTHASPRLHDRRGHLRTLQSGKQVWVRSCKVGKAELGTIFHDYEVRA